MNPLNLSNKQIKKHFNELLSSGIYTSQKRGYEFEKLISAKLFNEKLEPKTSYRAKGEQIDGSFFWEGQTFLLEAKWVKTKLSASHIYTFKGKLDGKFHTTSGVFLAVNGYNEDVEDALKFGKSLNILLFDGQDIELIFNNQATFLEVLKFKLRQAGDTGSLNAPYSLKEKALSISEQRVLNWNYFSKSFQKAPPSIENTDVLIFVEGISDVLIIENLVAPLANSELAFTYKIVALGGADKIRQLPSLLNVYGDYAYLMAAIVFLDDDKNNENMSSIIDNVKKQMDSSFTSLDVKFYFINENLKSQLDQTEIRKFPKPILDSPVIEDLRNFLQIKYAEYNYDPEVDIPQESIKWIMSIADFDYEEGEVIFPSDIDHIDTRIDNVEDLVEHLNEAIVSEMDGRMPLYWLKEQDYLDYDTEVREYLIENHKKDIKKLKWDFDSL